MVGLAFQRPEEQLFCDTVHEEVAFGPAHQGIRGRDLEARVRDVLRLMGIEELADCSPFQLSGGQARRVALASVIACGTIAYVFDESTAGLDGAAAAHLRSLVRALADEGAAIVVVSHDVCTWLDIADDVVLLRDGHEVWEGGADELVGDPEAFAVSALELPLPLAIAAACARGGEPA
jgi:energy-coupling factor transporter ATP-binding protein EcfA2